MLGTALYTCKCLCALLVIELCITMCEWCVLHFFLVCFASSQSSVYAWPHLDRFWDWRNQTLRGSIWWGPVRRRTCKTVMTCFHYSHDHVKVSQSSYLVVCLSSSFVSHTSVISAFSLCSSDRGEKKVFLNLLYVNQCWECAFNRHHTNSKRFIL